MERLGYSASRWAVLDVIDDVIREYGLGYHTTDDDLCRAADSIVAEHERAGRILHWQGVRDVLDDARYRGEAEQRERTAAYVMAAVEELLRDGFGSGTTDEDIEAYAVAMERAAKEHVCLVLHPRVLREELRRHRGSRIMEGEC